jgi:hypothetical protein
MERMKGHYIQVNAIMSKQGDIFYPPEWSLCAYGNCVIRTDELVRVWSETHQRDIYVCPDCVKKVEEVNKNVTVRTLAL